jgi:hypothetical protein
LLSKCFGCHNAHEPIASPTVIWSAIGTMCIRGWLEFKKNYVYIKPKLHYYHMMNLFRPHRPLTFPTASFCCELFRFNSKITLCWMWNCKYQKTYKFLCKIFKSFPE